jgi:hypothetical protein
MSKKKGEKKLNNYRSPIWHYTLDAILLYIRTKEEWYNIKKDELINFQQFVSWHLNNRDTWWDSKYDETWPVSQKPFDDFEKDFSMFEK